MNLRVRLLVSVAAVAGAVAAVATALWSRQWNVVTITVLVAVTWATAISVVDALVAVAGRRPAPSPDRPRPGVPVTYAVRLGKEHRAIAETSLALAAEAGPVVVLATRHHELLDDLGIIGIREYVRPTIAEALRDAALEMTTDAVLVLSASAFPLRDACAAAAARLTGNVGWATGTASVFNHDRYAPGERELMSARSRDAARKVGLVTWEPDATIVRTSLLRNHPFTSERPDGSWLRRRAADGWIGASTREVVAVRAAPADAPMFWPAQTNRQRGVVADLADATTSGQLAARTAAVGALLRELYAWPIALWLFAIVMIGRSGTFPLSVSPLVFFSLHGALACTRWTSSRLAYGVGLHPVDEARVAAYDFPGALVALPSALSRRVRPIRLAIPDQPLLWTALVLTLVTTLPLLDRRASAGGSVGITVGLALATLTAVWIFALRSFGARGWDRATYRIALDLPATIDGRPARTIDASPGGLSLVTASANVARGSDAAVCVSLEAAGMSCLRSRVTEVRRAGEQLAVGLALELDAEERAAWARDLFAAAGATGRTPTLPIPTPSRRPLAFDRDRVSLQRRSAIALQRVIVTGLSLVVAAALLLAFLGYRPMVERSASMAPAVKVGDVVIAEWVRADRVRRGEIVSFADRTVGTDLVTHRVRDIRIEGGSVTVVTKGDANTQPEQWSTARETLVGHIVWKIPQLGRALIVVGEPATRRLILGATVAILSLVAVDRAIRRARRSRSRLQLHDVRG